jgi:hypothetical protein
VLFVATTRRPLRSCQKSKKVFAQKQFFNCFGSFSHPCGRFVNFELQEEPSSKKLALGVSHC